MDLLVILLQSELPPFVELHLLAEHISQDSKNAEEESVEKVANARAEWIIYIHAKGRAFLRLRLSHQTAISTDGVLNLVEMESIICGPFQIAECSRKALSGRLETLIYINNRTNLRAFGRRATSHHRDSCRFNGFYQFWMRHIYRIHLHSVEQGTAEALYLVAALKNIPLPTALGALRQSTLIFICCLFLGGVLVIRCHNHGNSHLGSEISRQPCSKCFRQSLIRLSGLFSRARSDALALGDPDSIIAHIIESDRKLTAHQ
ncbi:hypothetical protein T01_15343 [Trichinella spiralis]|uniref:Uncharacterized protein n=1 Tax=Trichinella spiralis TaxID=6334 RepID=A0A0V1BP56_TRISP|nr:hypothetical protein T01_15343 [Trichinella spiralis]